MDNLERDRRYNVSETELTRDQTIKELASSSPPYLTDVLHRIMPYSVPRYTKHPSFRVAQPPSEVWTPYFGLINKACGWQRRRGL